MNERDGKGKEYYENGNIKFEGEFSNGEKNGKIKEYDENGKLLFEGEYIKDKRINEIDRRRSYEFNYNDDLSVFDQEHYYHQFFKLTNIFEHPIFIINIK